MHKLEQVFNPRSVAVIGSKEVDNHSWLRTVLPFQGPKYHINVDKNEWPSAEALGFPSYSSLLDVPGEVDYVIISVPAPIVPRLLRDCVAKNVAGVHLYTAGFSETGTEEGERLEREIVDIAREGGLNVVGPNCTGIFNPKVGLGVNMGQYHGEHGNFAFISQSGSQAGGFTKLSLTHGIKVSKVVSMGNGIILDSADHLEYLGQDEDTWAIGLYLEGIRDGRRFFNVLRDVCARKPVLVWKVGETGDAIRAVASHSTSRTPSAPIWDAMLRQCGAVKVENVDELIEAAKLILGLPPATGNRLGLLAITGGHSTEMANVFSNSGFAVPPLAEESYLRILEHFNVVGSSYRNPIEGRTLTDPINMNNVLDVLNDDENIDIIVHEVQVATGGDKVSIYRGHGPDIFCQFRARATKPYMVVISPSFPQGDREVTEAVYNQLTEAGIPTVYGLQAAARALRLFADYHRYQNA